MEISYFGDPLFTFTEDNPLDNQRGIRSIYFKIRITDLCGGSRDDWRTILQLPMLCKWENKYGYSEQRMLSVFVNGNWECLSSCYSGIIIQLKIMDFMVSGSQRQNSLYYAGIVTFILCYENIVGLLL